MRKHWLDWHVNDWARNVAGGVDADRQAQTFVDAGIQAVGLFCKDHFGNCAYPTDIGHRHPHLTKDYVGEMTRALKARGLRAMAYFSVGIDRHTGLGHPDWQARDRDGRPRGGFRERGIGAVPCLNTPYTERVILPELAEIAGRYDVDGFLLDMATWQVEVPCYCDACRADFRRENGREIPTDPADPLAFRYRRWRNRHNSEFERKVRETLDGVRPGLLLGSNAAYGIVFPEPPSPFVDFLFHDPGQFFPLNFSAWGRYFATTGVPFEMETVSADGWGDFSLRTAAALAVECVLNMVNGSTLSITYQPYSDGSIEPEAYRRIGEVFDLVRRLEPFCRWTTSEPYVAVLHSAATHWSKSPLEPSGEPAALTPEGRGPLLEARKVFAGADRLAAIRGAHKALIESGYHCDIVNEVTLERTIDSYAAVVLPEQTALPASTVARLREFVARGGGILATHDTATRDADNWPLADSALGDVLGISVRERSPFPLGYLRPSPDFLPGVLRHPLAIPVEGSCLRVRPTTSRVLCPLVEPIAEWLTAGEDRYFTARDMPPPGNGPELPGITVNHFGEGVAVYASGELFASYWRSNLTDLKHLIARCLELAIPPERRLLAVEAPPSVEVALRRRGTDLIVHLVNFHAEKRQLAVPSIEWLPTIPRIPITLRCARPPRRVSSVPDGADLGWEFGDGVLRFTLENLVIHAGALVEF